MNKSVTLSYLAGLLMVQSAVAQVAPLSCPPLDVRLFYQDIAAAPDRYVIVQGSLFRTGPDVTTETRGPDLSDPFAFSAEFIGHIASRVGFRAAADLQVEVAVTCDLSWCGAVPPDGASVLAFLRVDDNRDYFLEVGPCGYGLYYAPDQAVLDQVVDCINGRSCGP